MSQMPPMSLLAVFAHPDDEAYGTAGLMARCQAEGIRTALVCATRGEAGQIADPSLATPASLGDVRQRELECACLTVGISHLYLIGYTDGGVAAVDPALATRTIAEIVRQERPDVVVTFGPEGVYGHPDHLAMHRFTVAAVQAVGLRDGEPDRPAWPIARLYYVAPPRSLYSQLPRILASAGFPVSPEDADPNPAAFGVPDEAITASVDVRSLVEVKRAAILCHRTQIFPRNPWALLPDDLLRTHLGVEHFSRAFPPPVPGAGPHPLAAVPEPDPTRREGTEDDLFANVKRG
ncbi:MAG: PIG-L family deacetylase [Chloroflexi bacterium]|nr:PIG-L family deacetylase [Chloroflexota bacterium]